MSFERSYSIESHEKIKPILIFADKSLLLKWWVTSSDWYLYILELNRKFYVLSHTHTHPRIGCFVEYYKL